MRVDERVELGVDLNAGEQREDKEWMKLAIA